jgi:hypothetical protein
VWVDKVCPHLKGDLPAIEQFIEYALLVRQDDLGKLRGETASMADGINKMSDGKAAVLGDLTVRELLAFASCGGGTDEDLAGFGELCEGIESVFRLKKNKKWVAGHQVTACLMIALNRCDEMSEWHPEEMQCAVESFLSKRGIPTRQFNSIGQGEESE